MNNPLLDTSSLPRFDDIAPEHVVPALETIIANNRQRLDKLFSDGGDFSFDNIVAPVEHMDHELSRVWSPVRHLQSVLGSSEWREAYNAALPLLTEYSTDLSQDARLQQAFARVAENLGEGGDKGAHSVVDHALRDFHLAGVDLPSAEKERFKAIMQELATVQSQFEHNVQDASDAWFLHIEDKHELRGIPDQALNRAALKAERRGLDGWILSLDYPTYDAVITHAENRELRQQLYRAWTTRASDQGDAPEWDNSDNIEKIMALRHEAAALVGFSSYADYSLATKMASTSGQVVSFLRELGARSRAAAKAELAELEALAGSKIEPWDATFWLDRLKHEKYDISNEVLRQYFPQQTVVSGLFSLATRLYGITLREDPGVETWHDTVRYFVVTDNEDNDIGGFYTDLFARSGKRGGAWIDECINRKKLGDEIALPVGYLVCNFPPPDVHGRSLLAHEEVVTLFHEFGHMLHHLLTRIDYPSIAGINGVPWDAVELPSQFMENFAWNYEVLTSCSAHAESGEPLPAELFRKMREARHVGGGMAMLRQLEFALFDIRLHAEYAPQEGSRVMQLLADVRAEISMFEAPDYNRFAHAFSHVFAGGYAAGYYSYKWAEVLAADAFEAFEQAGVFDSAMARRFREEILEIGGSRDIMEAYVAFRGREPEIGALLRLSGIE